MENIKSSMLDMKHKIGNFGFVEVDGMFGDENTIVKVARQSIGTNMPKHDKITLIKEIVEYRHGTPLEALKIRLHVKVPRHVWEQWKRYRTASFVEFSTRYSEAMLDAEVPSTTDLRFESEKLVDYPTNRQKIIELIQEFTDRSSTLYSELRKYGLLKEMARGVLTMLTYTEAYWTIDLNNLLYHFCLQRLNPHAQKEFRDYAYVISKIIAEWVPNVWNAFENYWLNSLTFSRDEIMAMNGRDMYTNITYFAMTKKEHTTMANKLKRLGLNPVAFMANIVVKNDNWFIENVDLSNLSTTHVDNIVMKDDKYFTNRTYPAYPDRSDGEK